MIALLVVNVHPVHFGEELQIVKVRFFSSLTIEPHPKSHPVTSHYTMTFFSFKDHAQLQLAVPWG